jgi:hypothetical protein
MKDYHTSRWCSFLIEDGESSLYVVDALFLGPSFLANSSEIQVRLMKLEDVAQKDPRFKLF